MVLFWALGCLLPQGAWAADIIVRRDQGLTASERAQLRADAGVEHERMLALPDTEVVSVPEEQEATALARLNANPDVVVAAPNVQVRIAEDPLPPYAPNYERGFPRESEKGNDGDIDATDAWEDGYEGSGVRIAVIDQAVDASHPDLRGKVTPAPEDFVTRQGCPASTATADHGTQVAGLAAAWQDGAGIAGVAPAADVLSLRAIDNCGVGDIRDVLEAFAWAAADERQVPIVVGSFVTSVNDSAEHKALVDSLVSQYVDEYPETLFVVAAGNEGANVDTEPNAAVYPCSNDAPNIVCVGMSDANDEPVCWSNVGGTSVDLFAPGQVRYGQGVLTTAHRSLVQRSGTSMAAPLVAGAAALVEGRDSTHDAASIKVALLAGVDEFTTYTGPTISTAGGRLNAARPFLEEGSRDLLGTGAPGGPWATCDPDHDQLRYGDDQCPTQFGVSANQGCPDTDNDGRQDRFDNCPEKPNPGWADTDGDGLGDVCDDSPRGHDSDGDGVYDLDDACHSAPGPAWNRGCPPDPPVADPPMNPSPPTPIATPLPALPRALQIFLKVDVTKAKAAKVRISVSRTSKVSLKIERRSGRKWKRVTATRSVTASVSVQSLTLRPTTGRRKLTKGRYRVTATVGRLLARKSFKVQ